MALVIGAIDIVIWPLAVVVYVVVRSL